jgi:predicted N-acetyltransferase YhbS
MVSIRALLPEDNRGEFRSGNDDLDRFFHRHAASNQFAEHIGTTYVAAADDGRILGFVTVAGASIKADSTATTRKRRLPSYQLPALRLARLAVGAGVQKKGIGSLLVRYTFALALEQAARVGCIGVLVDAKPESVDFYTRLGFEPVDAVEGTALSHPETTPVFLNISTIKAAIGGK